MCAFTLLASASASRRLLHGSSAQSWYTSDVNAIERPSGDQTGPSAPVERFVTCLRSPPEASIVQTCPPVTNAMRRPSGDQRGSLDEAAPLVNCFGSPPPDEIK